MFQSLSSLKLVDCDLSTSALAGLQGVRGSLRSLTCCNSLEELGHLLAPASGLVRQPGARATCAACRSRLLGCGLLAGLPGGPRSAAPSSEHAQARAGDLPATWLQLQHLTCVSNGFSAMDASLTLCPELRELDLSRNNIKAVGSLHACLALTRLVLSHNHISDASALPATAGRLRELSLQVGPSDHPPLARAPCPAWAALRAADAPSLQGNLLRSTGGLELLPQLLALDLRYNLICSLEEVFRLGGAPVAQPCPLPAAAPCCWHRAAMRRWKARSWLGCADLARLHSLDLAGNPIMEASFARLRALACLPQRAHGLHLDGSPASTIEAGVLAACGGERLPDGFAIIAECAPRALARGRRRLCARCASHLPGGADTARQARPFAAWLCLLCSLPGCIQWHCRCCPIRESMVGASARWRHDTAACGHSR